MSLISRPLQMGDRGLFHPHSPLFLYLLYIFFSFPPSCPSFLPILLIPRISAIFHPISALPAFAAALPAFPAPAGPENEIRPAPGCSHLSLLILNQKPQTQPLTPDFPAHPSASSPSPPFLTSPPPPRPSPSISFLTFPSYPALLLLPPPPLKSTPRSSLPSPAQSPAHLPRLPRPPKTCPCRPKPCLILFPPPHAGLNEIRPAPGYSHLSPRNYFRYPK